MTATRPVPSTPRDFHFPPFERSTIGTGLRVIVAPMHRLPVVTAILVLDGGAAVEPAGREGVSDIVARALSEGTRTKSADDLVMALERIGTSVSASSDWESTILKMTVLSPNLENAVSLMSEMVIEPRFDDASIDRLKQERVSEIVQARSEPRVLADEMFAATLYDTEARFAIPLGGSEESVSLIAGDDVREYHASNYSPNRATLILAGDVTTARATQIANKYLGTWAVSGATKKVPFKRTTDGPASTNQVRIVGRPGAQQSELRIGHVGVPRSVPEYFPIVVMNAVLGGLFSSRINLNLREVHGYTYGASSYFDWRRDSGPFVISSAVQSEATGPAVREVLNEVARMQDSKITDEELTLATSYLAGVFPIRYETSDAVASGLASLAVFNLPDNYFTTYRSNILSVTPEQVQEAARRFVHRSQLNIVVAGSPDIVEPQLKELGVGNVTVAPESK